MNGGGRRSNINYKPEHITSKMTPEMCRAIKRQERNGGFDYWKAGFNGSGQQSPSYDRRPTFQNMAHINLNFPGIFLPAVDGSSNKSRRKESSSNFGSSSISPQPVLLRRSNSMMSSMPSRRGVSQTQTANGSKKAVLTDLTCLQLTDTLLSYSGGSFPGLSLFRTPSNRSRFMDYLYDERGDNEELNERESNTSDDNSRIGVTKYHTILPEDSDGSISQKDSLPSQIEINSDIDKDSTPKPFKSILKNNHNSCAKTATFIYKGDESSSREEKVPKVCSYQLPNPRNNIVPSATYHNSSGQVSLESIRPKAHSGYVYNTLRRQQSARSSARVVPIDYENHLGGFVNEMSARKRSVRFNVVHQVHEYKPFEPITNY